MDSRRRSCLLIAVAWLAGSVQPVSAQSGTLALNQSKTVTVRANEPFNYSHIRLVKDQRYRFTVTSPAWNNGTQVTDAGGYNDQVYPVPDIGGMLVPKRYDDFRRMELVAEIFAQDENPSSEKLTHFRIGLGREWTATRSGFLVTGPNDCSLYSAYQAVSIPCYGDNSRVVTLTVTRIQ